MADETVDDWRYSHDEIEAACGGERALEVRAAVMKRRKRIIAEMEAERKLRAELAAQGDSTCQQQASKSAKQSCG